MKKRLFVSMAALSASALMLAGSASAATAEDVLNSYMEASKDLKEFSASIDMDAKASLNMTSETSGTSSMGMGMTASLNAGYKTEPLSMVIDGDMTVDALGVSQAMKMNIYVVPGDDGKLDSYANVDTGDDSQNTGWTYSSVAADEVKQLTDMMANQNFDFTSLPFTYNLADGEVDVDGTSCYQVTCAITYDDLKTYLPDLLAAAGEDELDEDTQAMMDSILSGLVVNMELDIAADTYYPVKMRMDMDGSDFSTISQLIAYSMAESAEDGTMTLPEISLDVSSLYMEAVYDYTTPVDITVPADALLAKATGNDSNVTSIGDLVEDIAEAESEED